MERTVIWLPQSKLLLTTIYRHIIQQSKSEPTAFKLISRIQQAATTLLTFPQAGTIEPLLKDSPTCYRSLVTEKHYKIIYSIKDEKRIEIAAVWDCRQDPEKLQQTL